MYFFSMSVVCFLWKKYIIGGLVVALSVLTHHAVVFAYFVFLLIMLLGNRIQRRNSITSLYWILGTSAAFCLVANSSYVLEQLLNQISKIDNKYSIVFDTQETGYMLWTKFIYIPLFVISIHSFSQIICLDRNLLFLL